MTESNDDHAVLFGVLRDLVLSTAQPDTPLSLDDFMTVIAQSDTCEQAILTLVSYYRGEPW